MLAGLSLSAISQAQITLSSTNAPSIAQCQISDTFTRVQKASIPTLAAGTNMTWDLTTAIDSTNFYLPTGAVSNASFPNAKFYSDGFYPFSGFSYTVQNMKDVSAAGIVVYGTYMNRQAIPLGALTGDSGDSIVFPQQAVPFSTPEREVKFPVTMSDTWTDQISYSTDFNLTISAYGFNSTPGERRTKLTLNNNVVGWGKMRVNDRNGNPTGYMDVLMVQTEEITSDSFFLGGSPAPAPLLSAFGLSQNNEERAYYTKFRRAGEYSGLVEIIHTDNTYTTPTRFDIHLQRLAPTAISNISKEQLSIYPNPVTGGQLTVKLNDINSSLSYQIYNITGQQVATGKLAADGVISLQPQMPTGTYILKLTTDDGAYTTERVNIMQ